MSDPQAMWLAPRRGLPKMRYLMWPVRDQRLVGLEILSGLKRHGQA
jgi:hypothetical protein